jgi:hypothetical protein
MIDQTDRTRTHRDSPLGQGQDVVLPDYAGDCIVNVPRLVSNLLSNGTSLSPLDRLTEAFRGVERIVLLLLDGLGHRKLSSLLEKTPDSTLGRWAERGTLIPLTSVFPSTTVAALTSLSTGLTPLEHGMIGYRLFLRETASITNMIRFSMIGNARPESAFSVGLDPETLIPHPTIHQELSDAGVATHSIVPGHIAGSGLSNALYRGCAKLHAAVSLPDMLVRTQTLLKKASGRTFISLYWPGLDSVGHVLGPESASYEAEFHAVDDALRRGVTETSGDTLWIVTADHGFASMVPEDYLLLDSVFDATRTLLMPPVGEPRASYLYTRNGTHDAVRRAFQAPRDDGLICMNAEELLGSGLLGLRTPHPEIAHRIGDLALLSTGAGGTFQDYPDAALLRGMHGGLTESEMLVPLILTLR